MTKKKLVRGIVLFAVYIFIFWYLLKYISNNAEIMERISNAPISYVIAGLFCSCVSIIFTGVMDVTCANVYGVKVRYGESIGLTYIASAVNLVLPLQMGSIVKAVYLKKKLTLTYSKYISIVSGTAIINLLITFVQLIVCLTVAAVQWSLNTIYMWVLAGIFFVAIMGFAAAIRFQDIILRILPFKTISVPIMSGFFELLENKRAVLLVTANLAFCSILGGLRFYFIFAALGYSEMLLNGMLYYGLYSASTIMPILPGNIGISEAIVGITNQIVSNNASAGIAVVLVNRIYYYLAAIAGAAVAAYPIWRLYHKTES